MTHYLPKDEKRRCRELWREAFPEDSDEFTDYYFKEKIKDNHILVREEGGRVISMLHRNPYQIQAGSQTWLCDYIVGVATAQDYRKRGYMRELLSRTLRDMREDKMPFCFLMPADEAIYLPFGFTYIFDQPQCMLDDRIMGENEFTRVKIGTDHGEGILAETAAWMQEWLSRRYEVYTVRDAEYVRNLLKELESEAGYLEILCSDRGFDLRAEIVGMYAEWGLKTREQRLLLGESGVICREMQKKPVIMGRILHLQEFVKVICLKRAAEMDELLLILKIEDPLLGENNRIWCWHLNHETSWIAADEYHSPDITLSIQELTSWLFGYNVPAQAEAYNDTIRVLKGVFLDEVV